MNGAVIRDSHVVADWRNLDQWIPKMPLGTGDRKQNETSSSTMSSPDARTLASSEPVSYVGQVVYTPSGQGVGYTLSLYHGDVSLNCF